MRVASAASSRSAAMRNPDCTARTAASATTSGDERAPGPGLPRRDGEPRQAGRADRRRDGRRGREEPRQARVAAGGHHRHERDPGEQRRRRPRAGPGRPRRRASTAANATPAHSAASGRAAARPITSSASTGGEPEPSLARSAPVRNEPEPIRSGTNQSAATAATAIATGTRCAGRSRQSQAPYARSAGQTSGRISAAAAASAERGALAPGEAALDRGEDERDHQRFGEPARELAQPRGEAVEEEDDGERGERGGRDPLPATGRETLADPDRQQRGEGRRREPAGPGHEQPERRRRVAGEGERRREDDRERLPRGAARGVEGEVGDLAAPDEPAPGVVDRVPGQQEREGREGDDQG